jgi:hypothetical protein
MEVVVTGQNFESILPKDHPCHVCFKILADWFQKRRLLKNFPIGSYVKTMSADGDHFEPRSVSLNTNLFKANMAWMVLKWSIFKIVSRDPDLHPRWPPSADLLVLT